MITLFAEETQNFAGNGLMEIGRYCTRCDLLEELNGPYSADIELATFEGMDRIQEGMVLRLPANVRQTPYMEIAGTHPSDSRRIYRVRVTTSTERTFTYIYSKPRWDYQYAIKRLHAGDEYEHQGEVTSYFHRAVTTDGTSGYILNGDGEFVRSEGGEGTMAQVIASRQTRDQLFRIKSLTYGTHGVTIFARHISADLGRDNYVPRINAENASGAQLAQAIFDGCATEHPFNIFSDVAGAYTGQVGNTDPISALMGTDNSLTTLLGGEVLRDNFDIYYAKSIGTDRGASIEYGKNATNLDITEDEDSVCTRVIPIAYDKDNVEIMLPETYCDSPRAAAWDRPRGVKTLDLRDVKIGDEFKDLDALYAEMRKRAQEYFETGVDQVQISASCEYVDLSKTNAAGRGPVSVIFLGDTVLLRDSRYKKTYKAKVVSYVFDALTQTYRSLGFGSMQKTLGNIKWAAENIANGSISAVKLMAQSVTGQVIATGTITGGNLADATVLAKNIAAEAITADKIAAGAIGAGHIAAGSIETDKLAAGAVTAEKIAAGALSADQIAAGSITTDKLAAGAVTTDKLAAKSVTADKIAAGVLDADIIAAGSITADKIAAGSITADKIAAGSVTADKIASKSVTTDKLDAGAVTADKIKTGTITAESGVIANAAIGTAQIQLAAITAALIDKGAVGTVQIADGSITSAKVVDLNADVIKAGTLSVERLLIAGEDGLIYAINATSAGLTASQLKQEQYKNYINGTVIVAKSITAAQLAARTITANEIVSGTITANEIAANAITAAKIKAGEITADKLASNVGAGLELSSNKSITLLVEQTEGLDDRLGSAEQKITPNAIVSTVRSSESYASDINGAKNGAIADTDNKLKNYSTTAQMNSAITQSANSITSTVSATYATKTQAQGYADTAEANANTTLTNTLKSYPTTTQMNSAITQSANSITSTVSATYATKTQAQGYADTAEANANTTLTNTLKNYTTITQTDSKISAAVASKASQQDIDNAISNITEFHNTAVDIAADGVSINTTGAIRASVNNQERLTIDKDGVSADRVVVRTVLEAPNVVLKNTVATIAWKGSIQASIDAAPKWLMQDAVLTIPAGTYQENVTVQGFTGAQLTIQFANGAVLNGTVTLRDCQRIVLTAASLGYGKLYPRSALNAVTATNVQYLKLSNLYFSGYRSRTSASNGSNCAVMVSGGYCRAENCGVEYAKYGFFFEDGATGYLYNNVGGQSGTTASTNANLVNGIYVGAGAHVAVDGKVPMGGSANVNAALGTMIQGTLSPTAGGMSYTAPSQYTKAFAISKHCTYIYGNSRIPDTDSTQFSQGRYGTYSTGSNMWRTGAMWFASATSELSGKTIISAKLTLRRASGGWSDPVPVYLGSASITESNYASTTAVTFTASGTQYPGASLDRETEGEYDVTDLMTAVKNGYAIAVKEKVASYSGNHSPAYTQFYGKGSAYEPVLTVTYK